MHGEKNEVWGGGGWGALHGRAVGYGTLMTQRECRRGGLHGAKTTSPVRALGSLGSVEEAADTDGWDLSVLYVSAVFPCSISLAVCLGGHPTLLRTDDSGLGELPWVSLVIIICYHRRAVQHVALSGHCLEKGFLT